MHYKKRQLHKLHSIPIGLCKKACSLIRFSSGRVPRTRRHGSRPLILGRDLRKPSEKVLKEHSNLSTKRLYLVSYSIPLSLLVVLLLGFSVMINPSSTLKTNAIEVSENVSENSEEDKEDVVDNASNTQSDGSFGYLDEDEMELSQEDVNSGISLLSASPASLTITVANGTGEHGAGVNAVVETSQDASTAYRSHDISITGSNLKSYTVTISGPSNLSGPSGAVKAITGANGAYGESMLPDTWGYAWGNTTDDDVKMQYKTLNSSGTTLESGDVDATGNVVISKKLVFGANFSTAATPGTYTANVTLSAVATPLATSFTVTNNYMQNMTKAACRDVAVGTTGILTDNRPGYSSGTMTGSNGATHNMNQYVIVKLPDGHCWMQENLRIGTSSAITLTPSNTDIASNYTLPASSDDSWETINSGTSQMRVGRIGMTVSADSVGDGNGWQPIYGNYYSWCAATAGTCSEVSSGKNNVSGSICPKSWRLPSGGDGESNFRILFYRLNLQAWNWSNAFNEIISAPYSYVVGGVVWSNGLQSPGDHAGYWSSTSYDAHTYTYGVSFGRHSVLSYTHYQNRCRGYSVRCIADY